MTIEEDADELFKRKVKHTKFKRNKIIAVIGTLLVILMLLFSMIVPVDYTDISSAFLENNENKKILDVGDEPLNGSAYNYWYAPGSSFGVNEMKTVNGPYFKQLFLAHIDWVLEYKRYSYSDWTNGSDYLTIDRTWNESGFWKFNLIFDVPVHVYSARFTFGVDLSVLQYVERSGYEVWINYTANATENYSVYFNWSDIASIPGLVITKGKTNNMFWFRFRRDDIPAGHYEFDPIFGYNVEGAGSAQIEGDMFGIWGIVVDGDGTVNNISAYVGMNSFTGNVSAGLYTYIDYSSDYAGSVIQWADNNSYDDFTQGAHWETWDFSIEPSVINDTKYYLVLSAEDGGLISLLREAGAGYSIYELGVQQESPWIGEGTSGYHYCIYANYTVDVGNSVPTQSAQKIWNSTTSTEWNLNATGVSLTPTSINVTINDADGDNMNITIMRNNSGVWEIVNQTSGSGLSNGSYNFTNISWINTQATQYNITFNVTDGEDWINESYNFTTLDSTLPIITINFAGNLSDSGGPYWRPPGESTQLAGVFSDGYYANNSRQHEDWIYANVTASDSESVVTNVWLQWLNDTTWTNWTYAFANTVGDYWEYNTSGNIQTHEGYNYSFNIVANSTGGTNITEWNKTGLGGSYTRRYVQLNCTLVNISYTPYYLYHNTTESGVYGLDDRWKEDRMHHDQGADAGEDIADAGVMDNDIPNDNVSNVYCGGYFGYWFDESVSVEDIELQSIYYHVWQSTKYGDDIRLSFQYGREDLCDVSHIEGNYIVTSVVEGKSTIVYDGGLEADYNTTFTLSTELLNTNSANFTDNSIYELYTYFRSDIDGAGKYPYFVSNRSFTSFIIPNVPTDIWDGTDNSTDTDSDGLSDHMELNTSYGTHTNPFLADTDNDGVNDSQEHTAGTDPNNWSDFWSNTAPTLTSESPVNGSTAQSRFPTLSVVVTDADGNNSVVDWYYLDGAVWYHLQHNASIASGDTARIMNFTNASVLDTTYYWKVHANDAHDNISEIYHFTTKGEDYIELDPGTTFIVGNEDYTNNVTLYLSQILISDTWIMFNTSGFYVDSTNSILFRIMYINPSTASAGAGEKVLEFWTENGTGKTWYNISGLTPGINYQIKRNGSTYTTSQANATGNISFNYTGNHMQHWEILVTDTGPTLTNEVPLDTATGILLAPISNVTARDPNGDTMNVSFADNSSGSWIIRQTNSSVSNGSQQWIYTGVTSWSTKYFWRAYADDGVTNNSETYSFTTTVNNSPTIVGEVPNDGATGVSLQPTCNVTVNDTEDTMNVYFYNSTDGIVYTLNQTNSSVSNSSVEWIYTMVDSYDVTYYWRVSVNDSINNVTESYSFTTSVNNSPIFSGDTPSNGSSNVPLSTSIWNITITDTEADTFNWTIETSPDIGSNSSNGDTNGSKEVNISGNLSYSITYTVYVNATDLGSKEWTREWFTFATSANNSPTFGTPSPINGSSNQNLSFNWSIAIEDPEGDVFNWTIECNNTQTNSSNYDGNGTKNLTLSGLVNGTTYTVWVNASDGNGSANWSREWFIFTTLGANNPPNVSTYPIPGNYAQNVPFNYGYLRCLVEDPDNDIMNVSFYWGNGTLVGNDTNVWSGEFASITIPRLPYGRTYTWYVNVTDEHGLTTRSPNPTNWTFFVEERPSGDNGGNGIAPQEVIPSVDDTLGLEPFDWTVIFILIGAIAVLVLGYIAYITINERKKGF